MKSWNAKVLRFDLVQAVSAVKSSRVWRQVHPVYIGLPILYDEGKQKNTHVDHSFLWHYSIVLFRHLGSVVIVLHAHSSSHQ